MGFGNETGGPITQYYLIYFSNFINSASVYYRDSTAQRHAYISDQMNQAYDLSGQGFSIFEDGNGTNFDWQVRNSGYYASLASGVDRTFPAKSYMFNKFYSPAGRINLYQVNDKGSGMTASLLDTITKTILSVESAQKSCQCKSSSNAHTIFDQLFDQNLGYWNTICSENATLAATVYAYGAMGIYLKPKNCYYVVYRSP